MECDCAQIQMVDTATATRYRSSGANAVIRFTIRESAGKRLMVSAHHAAISSHRVSEALIRDLGSAMRDGPPEMASDDFPNSRPLESPTLMLRVGAVEQDKLDGAAKSGLPAPSLHSSRFVPDVDPTIHSERDHRLVGRAIPAYGSIKVFWNLARRNRVDGVGAGRYAACEPLA
jgi:hypothetical protein